MCVRMQNTGMTVDRDALSDLAAFLGRECTRLDDAIEASTGYRINPGSPDQVSKLLFQDLKLHLRMPVDAVTGKSRDLRIGITPTGKVSTNKLLIEQLIPTHPCVLQILERRQADKLRGTYALAMLEHARPDRRGNWRVHTTLNTTKTDTGRLSSEDPNLQNIPQRSELGRRVKACFIASIGKLLYEVDYSQIEMRVAAALAQVRLMIAEFAKPKADIHTQTAMKVFGLAKEDVDEQLHRYPMKRAGFLILYKGSGKALSVILNALDSQDPSRPRIWTAAECDELIAGWYAANPEIAAWQWETEAYARRHGIVCDMFGRIRGVPEVYSVFEHVQDKGIRQACNMPIQSGAQGLIKLAMAELFDLYDYGYRQATGVEELMQIHDALLMEADEAMVIDAAKGTRDIMEGVCELDNVPVKADAKWGRRWGTGMEKIAA